MAKGKVTFDTERCKGCGLCVNACPVNILALDSKNCNKQGYQPAKIIEPDKCIACANCAISCPDVCITVEKAD